MLHCKASLFEHNVGNGIIFMTVTPLLYVSEGPFIYYTAIALRCRYIDYFLLQVTGFTVFQFKMNLTFNATPQRSNIAISVQEVQCSNATQLRCSMNGPLSVRVKEIKCHEKFVDKRNPIDTLRQPCIQ